MPITSDFLPFATAPDANVTSQSDWIGDPVVPEGFMSGVLPSAKTNKAIRQASFIAAGVAQMVSSTLGVDVLDDGNLGYFSAQLASAVANLGGGEGSAGAVNEAPNDGFYYARGSLLWQRALRLAGGTMTGQLILAADPVTNLGAATKQYVDAGAALAISSVQRGGDTMTGPLILSANPTNVLGAATKQYVDTRTPVPMTVALGGTGATTLPIVPQLGALVAPLGSFLIGRGTSPILASSVWSYWGDSGIVGYIATNDNAQGPYIDMGRARGTPGSRLPITSGMELGSIYFDGYGGGTPNPWSTGGYIGVTATEDWTGTAHGSKLWVSLTPKGASSMADILVLDSVDGLVLNCDVSGVRLYAYGATALLTIDRGLTGAPAAFGGRVPLMQLVAAPGVPSNILFDTFNIYGGLLSFRQANGTPASPTPSLAGNNIGVVEFLGRGATAYTQAAAIVCGAAENWTATAQGAKISFATNPYGSTVNVNALSVGPGYLVTVIGDLLLDRRDQDVGYLLRPNVAGFKKMAFATSGGGNLSHFLVYSDLIQFSNNIYSCFYGSSGQFHMLSNSAGTQYGSFWRNDGGNTYLLVTDNNNAFGSFNSLRPFTMENANANIWLGYSIQIGSPIGGQMGPGTLNASAIYANAALLTSDARYKRDIAPLPERCLALVNAIRPKSFRHMPGKPVRLAIDADATDEELRARQAGPPGLFTRRHWGFIAQEVAATMGAHGHDFGGHVIGGEDEIQSLSYNDLLAVLWQAVRELAARTEQR